MVLHAQQEFLLRQPVIRLVMPPIVATAGLTQERIVMALHAPQVFLLMRILAIQFVMYMAIVLRHSRIIA